MSATVDLCGVPSPSPTSPAGKVVQVTCEISLKLPGGGEPIT